MAMAVDVAAAAAAVAAVGKLPPVAAVDVAVRMDAMPTMLRCQLQLRLHCWPDLHHALLKQPGTLSTATLLWPSKK